MLYEKEIILILDSILDDYYFLWECYSEYNDCVKSERKSLRIFSEALKEAYENKYFNFYKGQTFDGDEVLVPEFSLTDSAIQELLNWKNESKEEIRLTTSESGVQFLTHRKSH